MRLGVNIDHVATVRQARQIDMPDPVIAAQMAVRAGAHQITAHLREDRRHIQDYDIYRLKEEVDLPLNLEMAATSEMVEIACDLQPYCVTLVPEKRQEITTEGGLNVTGEQEHLKRVLATLKQAGIRTSLFVDANEQQIRDSAVVGAEAIEIHTGQYAEVADDYRLSEQQAITEAANLAASLGLAVHAGHGLNLDNVRPICRIPHIEELNIGHSIVGRSIYVGFEQAVREMLDLMMQSVGTPA